jgi:hypothetical protein
VGKSERDVHLYVDWVRFDSEYGGAAQARKHDATEHCKISRRLILVGIPRVWWRTARKRWSFCDIDRARTVEFVRAVYSVFQVNDTPGR